MKLLNYGQSLFAPVNDGTEGSGGGTGGSSSAAAFDQAAFTATILGEFNKALAAQAKVFKADLAKLATAKPATVTPTPDPDPVSDPIPTETGTGDKAKADPVLQARLLLMEKKLRDQASQFETQFAANKKATDEQNAAVELRDRHAAIREQLASPTLQFGSDAQRDTAFRIFSADIRRLEDNSLVGGAGDLPLREYIGETMKAHQYLLAPKDVAGAGARGGKGSSGAHAVDIDSIKPGMSAGDLAAATAEISAVLAGR